MLRDGLGYCYMPFRYLFQLLLLLNFQLVVATYERQILDYYSELSKMDV
jgi:hypothetical protein